jgi:predicted MarR family transcription regulator
MKKQKTKTLIEHTVFGRKHTVRIHPDVHQRRLRKAKLKRDLLQSRLSVAQAEVDRLNALK